MDTSGPVPVLTAEDALYTYPDWTGLLRDLMMKGGPRLHAEFTTNQTVQDGPLVTVQNWTKDAAKSANESAFISGIGSTGSASKNVITLGADGVYDFWVLAKPTASPGTSHIQIYVGGSLAMVNDGPARTWEFGCPVPGIIGLAGQNVEIKANTQNALSNVPFRLAITRRSA